MLYLDTPRWDITGHLGKPNLPRNLPRSHPDAHSLCVPLVSQPGPRQLRVPLLALTFSQVPSYEEGDVFIAIASSFPSLLPVCQAEQPGNLPFSSPSLWCRDLCLDEHFSWKSPSPAVTQRRGRRGGTLVATEASQFDLSLANDMGAR